ncbi:guanylate kinase [Oceanibaculum pacificum]|uniref:Guanylate kinase n=1 Tax=Oceanibaculum pacificum TaxID=580166 RepID=A0A154WEI7_9PROT|nr:guanylate kinase [Oceanibaculum pacificum]KZD11941.1 guanylate kinase [Oceanibaculum pacificum]
MSSKAAAQPPEISRRGLMLVLSSPSGAGKTSISRRLLQEDRRLTMSVSVTTRAPRSGEVDGRDYHFIDVPRFEEMVEDGQLLEHARVFGNYYGTPRGPVEAALAAGNDILFDVDWQGTQQLNEKMPDDVVGVFILPPSHLELERRLRSRAQDSEEVVIGRMKKAADEMSHWPEYDYVIVNHDLETCVSQVTAILWAERLKRERQVGVGDFVRGLIADGPA